jgi:hypothetical protein
MLDIFGTRKFKNISHLAVFCFVLDFRLLFLYFSFPACFYERGTRDTKYFSVENILRRNKQIFTVMSWPSGSL